MRLAVPPGFPGLPGQRPPALSRLRIWFTASMGFLTDAYDLFVIGAIIDIFNAYRLPGFHDPRLEAILASSAIFAAIAGQLAMGRISDAFGRKFIYGVEAMLLAAGAILSAIAPNMIWLIASRVILGMGIGGDYPLSAVIASEYSCAENRGRLVGLVFAAQGIGAAAAVLASIGAAAMLPPDLAWRTIAAAGAVPAILVVYLRRRLPETPRYSALVKGDYAGARRAADELGIKVGSEGVVARSMGAADFIRRYWLTLLGTALPWFLMDIAFYGTGIYSATIVTGILGTPSSIVQELFEAGLPYIVGAPGYFVSVALLDRVGRKSLQMGGFLGMAIIYIIVSRFVIGGAVAPALSMAIYSLSFLTVNIGPNTTTFVLPSEVFPVRYRSTGHGISAAAGKAGAGLSTLWLIPALTGSLGVGGTLEVLAILSVLGALATLLLREPARRTLEEASREETVPIEVRAARAARTTRRWGVRR